MILIITLSLLSIQKFTDGLGNESNQTSQHSNDMTAMKMMMDRGDIAMGFNQSAIAHQFIATPYGGKIIITALKNNDTETISQIKNHTLQIQKDFSQGNFTKPFFIHSQEVVGTNVMSQKKDLIKYDVSEMRNGSILMLTTNDTQLIDAIHQFMEFQSSQHYGH
jgi:hypothetical protein